MIDLDDDTRDLVTRTILGEAGAEPDEGQQAVAAVIRNRLASGRHGESARDVVLAKNQFEPWSTSGGRQRMMSYAPDSTDYQRALGNVGKVFSGEAPDPTEGATHFFSPTAQAALGRQAPKWAQGEGLPIGRHAFYAPEGRVKVASKDPTALPDGFELIDDEPQQKTAQAGAPAADADPSALPPGFELVADNTFDARFKGEPGAEIGNKDALKAGLANVAREATTGPATSPAQQIAIDLQNQGPSASQGTTPNIAAHTGNLVSRDLYENDAGEVMYKDPATGELTPTDQNKQVALRDPADNTPKLFNRTNDTYNSIGLPTGTDEGRLSAAGRILGLGMATGAPTKRPSVPAIGKAPAPSIDELKEAASAAYKSPAAAAVEIKAPALERAAQNIRAALNERGWDENVAPKTFGILSKASDAPADAIVSVKNLESLRRTLGNAAKSIEPTERLAARTAMNAVDDFLTKIPQADLLAGDAEKAASTLGQARGNYSAAMRAEDIDRKTVKAELRAASTNSGQNVANTIRQRMADLLTNPPMQRGFTPDEMARIEKIVKGTPAENMLRGAGNMLGGGGGMGAMVSAGAGALATGGWGAIAPGVGFVLKKLGNSLTMKQVDKLSETIRSRSPLAQSLEDASGKWSKAAQAFSETPTPPRYAVVFQAARELSGHMQKAGVELSPDKILRTIQGPVQSAAEDEQ